MSGLLIITISFYVLVSMVENKFVVVVDLLPEYRSWSIFAFKLYIYVYYIILYFSLKIAIFPHKTCCLNVTIITIVGIILLCKNVQIRIPVTIVSP